MRILVLVLFCAVACDSGSDSKSTDSDKTADKTAADKAKPAADKTASKAPPATDKKGPNPMCDKALPADFVEKTCGAPIKMRSTPAEGIPMNPCSRGGKGLLFIVSEHRSGKVAAAGKAVVNASTDNGNVRATVKSGKYLIEMKASAGSACASEDKLKALASKAAETLN